MGRRAVLVMLLIAASSSIATTLSLSLPATRTNTMTTTITVTKPPTQPQVRTVELQVTVVQTVSQQQTVTQSSLAQPNLEVLNPMVCSLGSENGTCPNPIAGEPIIVSFDVLNRGNVPSAESSYALSINGQLSPITQTIPTLAPGQTIPMTTQLNGNFPAGTYSYGIWINNQQKYLGAFTVS